MDFQKRTERKSLKIGNRKSSILDILFWTIIIFVLVIGFLIVKYVWGEIYSGMQSSDIYKNTDAAQNIDKLQTGFFPLFDTFLIMIIVGVMLATIIGAYALRTSPLFYILALLFTVIEIIIAVPLSNAYTDQISHSSELQATADTFTVTNFVISYLPLWVFIFNCIVSIVMYGLGRQEYG